MAKDKNIKNKKSLLQKLRYKYRLIILNEDTFEQKTSMRLSRLNLYVLGSVLFLIVVLIVTAAIAFTPLKYYMPGVGSIDVRTQLIEVEMLTDSLERQLDKRNLWLQNFQKALSGDLDSTFFIAEEDVSLNVEHVDIQEISVEEQTFREDIEDEIEVNSIVVSQFENNSYQYYPLKFVSPTDGLVIAEFNSQDGHFGIDIAGAEEEAIKAVESGMVIVADWNPETGYVIGLQHKNNTISFYKHNSVLLKKVGSFVKRGDVIALMGNSGNLTNGPHLHFELWQNGVSVNPLNFIEIKNING